jgi:hypothetical protein
MLECSTIFILPAVERHTKEEEEEEEKSQLSSK